MHFSGNGLHVVCVYCGVSLRDFIHDDHYQATL